MIIDFDDNLVDKRALQLPPCLEQFRPLLNPTLAKMHEMVSLLTYFSELKFDHRFGCPFDRQVCMPTFMMFQVIFTPFKPNLSETAWQSFTKTNFSELKFDYRFICMPTSRTFLVILTPFESNTCETAWRSFTFDQFLRIKFDHWFECPFHRQVCTPNFVMFWANFTPFKPYHSKIARWSFTFDWFVRIKIWSQI